MKEPHWVGSSHWTLFIVKPSWISVGNCKKLWRKWRDDGRRHKSWCCNIVVTVDGWCYLISYLINHDDEITIGCCTHKYNKDLNFQSAFQLSKSRFQNNEVFTFFYVHNAVEYVRNEFCWRALTIHNCLM